MNERLVLCTCAPAIHSDFDNRFVSRVLATRLGGAVGGARLAASGGLQSAQRGALGRRLRDTRRAALLFVRSFARARRRAVRSSAVRGARRLCCVRGWRQRRAQRSRTASDNSGRRLRRSVRRLVRSWRSAARARASRCTVFQEQLDDRQMAADGRFVQRRVAEPVFDQRDVGAFVDQRADDGGVAWRRRVSARRPVGRAPAAVAPPRAAACNRYRLPSCDARAERGAGVRRPRARARAPPEPSGC